MMKQSKGITLVALVLTIIILLILAGISISALTNQGLFTQAQNAKNLTEEKTAEENEILTNYLEQMNAILGGQVTESVPDGATVTPVNDIATWLKTAGISKQYSYTTIEQVIADNTCTESLMNNENAMKYLARSTEFADAICTSETAMTYLGQSAYEDDTVLNSDIWKQLIKASQYWTLVCTSKVVTVYGGAYETITIDGYYGSFTTNADGYVSHVVPIDMITLTGSVSSQSFTRTVTNDTTEVYVMPEGKVLYWYGYRTCDVIGKNSNSFPYLSQTIFNTSVNLALYEKLGIRASCKITWNNISNFPIFYLTNLNTISSKIGIGNVLNDEQTEFDISSINDNGYIATGGQNTTGPWSVSSKYYTNYLESTHQNVNESGSTIVYKIYELYFT